MARRNGQGPKQLQDVTEKLKKGELRLLKVLEEEGLITTREGERLLRQVTQAAAQKRASEVLSAAHTVHNKIVQVLRRGKGPGDAWERTELEVLYEITRLTQCCDDREKLFGRLLELAEQAIPFQHATLFLVDREVQELSVAASKGEVVDLIGGVKFDFGFGFSSWVAKQKKPILLTELNRGRRSTGVQVGSFLSVPLIVQGELIGVLNMSHSGTKAFGDEHLRMGILIAGQSAGVIQRFLMYEEMSRLAITDPLTGLFNRRHLQQHLADEIHRARRYDHVFSVAMIDLDNFKELNDTYGHALGDRILTEMGRLMRKCARSSDLSARYGGDEFVVLMPETDREQAALAGERLRTAIASHMFPRRKKLTVSVGLATFPKDGSTSEALLKKADRALLDAKRKGRNQVLDRSALTEV